MAATLVVCLLSEAHIMKKSTFEQMGRTYRQSDDYLLPNFVLRKTFLSASEVSGEDTVYGSTEGRFTPPCWSVERLDALAYVSNEVLTTD